MLVALNHGNHKPTKRATYEALLRERLREEIPMSSVLLLAADIVDAGLNFGLSAPIDVQVTGLDSIGEQRLQPRHRCRSSTRLDSARMPGRRLDVHLRSGGRSGNRSSGSTWTGRWRSRAGLTQSNVASDHVLVSLSVERAGRSRTSGSIHSERHSAYLVAVQTPQYQIDRSQAIEEYDAHWFPAPRCSGNPADASMSCASPPSNVTQVQHARRCSTTSPVPCDRSGTTCIQRTSGISAPTSASVADIRGRVPASSTGTRPERPPALAHRRFAPP